MVKFGHLGDCHLGSWRQPELQELNFQCFQQAITKCIEEKTDFILIAGDLFDSAYPSVEILKRTFGQFRRLREADIKCFMIAGSHDYSVSGKTFLEVIEEAGFCQMCKFTETEDGALLLNPLRHENFEIFGYPGKKSGLEVEDIKKIRLPESSRFRILMLHTSLTEAIGNLPIESVAIKDLPKAEYYALAHLHLNFNRTLDRGQPVVYSGPIFPNSFQELEDLTMGSFYIIEVTGITEVRKYELRPKEVISFNIEVKNALSATSEIIAELQKHDLTQKIVLLRLFGAPEQGTNADIDYGKIKQALEEKGAYSFLKNTNKLIASQEELKSDISISSTDMEKVEEELVKEYEEKNPNKFNKFIVQLMHSLDTQKQEDEKSAIFEARLFADLNKILGLDLKP